MAYSRQDAVSDGTLQVLDISIQYMRRADIFVLLDDVATTDWGWVGTLNSIAFPAPLALGVKVTVVRRTRQDKVIHEFAKGALFNSTTMDTDFRQMLYLAQEYTEGGGVSEFFQDVDMHGFRIRNLADAVAPGDAVTLQQLQSAVVNTDVTALRSELASSSGSSLLGYMASGTGAVPRTVQSRLREVVYVTDYGSVGTGGDDSPIIQAALDAAPPGGSVEFPNKVTLNIGTSLTARAYTSLNLNRSVLRQMPAKNLNQIIFVGSAAPGVVIRGGEIDVNASQQVYIGAKGDTGRGIFGFQCNSLRVLNVNFRNAYGSYVLAAASTGIEVKRCNIDDLSGTGHAGIELNQCSDSEIHHITGVGKMGISGYGVYVHGVTLRVNIHHCKLTYWQIVMLGIRFVGVGLDATMLFCHMDDNTLTGPSADTSIHNGMYCTANRNTIIDSGDVGMSMDYSQRCSFNDNVIRNANASGMALPGCQYCTAVGNVIDGCGAQWRIAVHPSQRCGIWIPDRHSPEDTSVQPIGNVVTDNMIRGDQTGTQPGMYCGIFLADFTTNVNTVRLNNITGWTSDGAALIIPSQTNVGQAQILQTITPNAGWATTPGYAPLRFYKDDVGRVWLEGVLTGGPSGVLGTLPVGYRPQTQQILLLGSGGTSVVRVDIFTNGDIVVSTTVTGFLTFAGANYNTR